MLNVESAYHALECAPPKPLQTRTLLTVCLEAGACALPRLVNLMAKLDIEPTWMQVEKPQDDRLEVTIEFGRDEEAMERLSLRLQGLVTVRSVTTTRA